jgi:hypothetical protein
MCARTNRICADCWSSLPAHSFLSDNVPGLADGAELRYWLLTFSHFGLPFGILLKSLSTFQPSVYHHHLDRNLMRQKNSFQ